jgi:hypothetical protein
MLTVLFVVIGLNVQIIFMLYEHILLSNKRFIFLLAFEILLLFICFLIQYYFPAIHKPVSILKLPIISILIYWLMVEAFKGLYNRNPQNTFWSFTRKPIQDVIFSLVFWFASLIPVIFLF